MSGRWLSPSARWTVEHGWKIQHRTWLSAWWHATQLNARPRNRREGIRKPYPCRWGQNYRDGEFAGRSHWHVGRPPERWQVSVFPNTPGRRTR